MAAHCGNELRKTDALCMSIWPGTGRTDTLIQATSFPLLSRTRNRFGMWGLIVSVNGRFAMDSQLQDLIRITNNLWTIKPLYIHSQLV